MYICMSIIIAAVAEREMYTRSNSSSVYALMRNQHVQMLLLRCLVFGVGSSAVLYLQYTVVPATVNANLILFYDVMISKTIDFTHTQLE